MRLTVLKIVGYSNFVNLGLSSVLKQFGLFRYYSRLLVDIEKLDQQTFIILKKLPKILWSNSTRVPDICWCRIYVSACEHECFLPTVKLSRAPATAHLLFSLSGSGRNVTKKFWKDFTSPCTYEYDTP